MNPLVLWNGILIDGYNRYKIVKKHDLPFNTTSLEFNSRDEVMAWMIKHQFERRNLTPMQQTYYRGLHYNLEKKIHGGDRHSQDFSKGQNDLLNGTTASRLSEQYRVSPRTIKRDAQIADVIIAIGKESIDAKTDILSGKTRISRKLLKEMASGPEEDIVKTATEIATGVFDADASKGAGDTKGAIGNVSSPQHGQNFLISNILTSGENPIKPGKYLHYKGNQYEVIGFAKNSETLDDMVIYTSLSGDAENKIWVRPLFMWEDKVKDESGKTVKRFEYIG